MSTLRYSSSNIYICYGTANSQSQLLTTLKKQITIAENEDDNEEKESDTEHNDDGDVEDNEENQDENEQENQDQLLKQLHKRYNQGAQDQESELTLNDWVR